MKKLLMIVSLLGAGCPHTKTPDSIAKALHDRPDEFPPPYLVVVPPRAGSVLGRTLSTEGLAAGRGVASEQACFLTTPHVTPSLTLEHITYKADSELKADLSKVTANASAHIKSDATATLDLKNLSIVTSVGIPNFDGCPFEDGDGERSTITSEIVADEARFDYSKTFDAGARIDAAALGKLEAGWVNTQNGTLQGSKILIGAKESRVKLQVETKEVRFPASSQTALPLGFQGQLAIQGYSDASQQVELLLTANAGAENPTKIPTCAVAPARQTLAKGEACILVLGGSASDNAGLFVSWETDGANAKVTLKGFRVRVAE